MQKTVMIASIPSFLLAVWYTFYVAVRYASLPARFATHFDLRGNPNGWMSRGFFLPFTMVLIWGLVVLIFAVTRGTIESSSSLSLLTAILSAGVGLEAVAFWQLIVSAIASRPPNFWWLLPGAVLTGLIAVTLIRLGGR